MILEPRNPFKNKTFRQQFDALVNCYNIRHRDLITSRGTRHNGNSWATNFWRGYDGLNRKAWDAGSRKMLSWACYRAGEEIRKLEIKNGIEPIQK